MKTPIVEQIRQEQTKDNEVRDRVLKMNGYRLGLFVELGLLALPHKTALRVVQQWSDQTGVAFLSVRREKLWRKTNEQVARDKREREAERESEG